MISLSDDNFSPVLPSLLQDQVARSAGDAPATPCRYHGVADLDSPFWPRWTVESNVADDDVIDNDLVDPPCRRLSNGTLHRRMGGKNHGDRIDAVGEWIFRMPARQLLGARLGR